MKKINILSVNDTDPANCILQDHTGLPNSDLLALGRIVGNLVPKSGFFTIRMGTISLQKSQHLSMSLFTG